MCAEDDELLRFLAALNFRNHVSGFNRTANLVGDGKINPHRMARRQQAGHALTVLPSHQHHGKAINLSRARVGVTIKNVMLAGGDECDGQRFPLYRALNSRRSLRIFREKIVPGLEHHGMHQNHLARDVAGFGEVRFAAVAHIDDRHMFDRG